MIKMDRFSRHLNNPFLRGSILFTVATFLGSFLNYVFNLIVAKKLGPTGFGEITALFSYTTIFSVPMAVITMVIIQKIGSNNERGLAYALTLEQWFLTKIKKWWLLLIPFLFLTPVIQKFTNLSFYSSASIAPFIMLSFIGAYYAALLQGLHLFGWISTIGIIAVLLKLSGAFAITDVSFGILIIIIFLFLSTASAVASSFIALRQISQESQLIHSKLKRGVLSSLFQKQVIITFFSILGLTLLGNADVVTAKKFLSAEQAGIYGSWSLFAKIILYLIGPLLTASYIFFSSLKNKKNHEKVLKLSLAILATIGIVSFLFYQYLSLPIVNLLFGSKFKSITPVLGLASIFGTLYASTTLINNYFLSKKSSLSLMPIVVGVIYIPAMYFLGRSLQNIITINLLIGTLLLLLQIGCLVKYNTDNGKQT